MARSKTNTKYIVTILILAALSLALFVVAACLTWSLASAHEKIDYLEEKLGDDSEVDPTSPIDFTVKKPLIYLYPTEDKEVSVKLGEPGNITTSYPKYDDGWRVFVQTDGKMKDNATGRSLYGLYWEGANYPARQSGEGFVVAGKDSAKFLQEKLAQLGLSEREANEMIIYWLPQLEKNVYNYIRFDLNDVMDEYMPLDITPKPDTIIRVSMVFKGLNTPISVREQQLPIAKREGFVVVEWGGSEIKK